MKKTLMKICSVALLTLVSMGVRAEIDVKIGTFTGGKITATQGDEKNGEVEVTLTVAPDEGYTITKDAIEVYATISPNGTRADDAIEISSKLELKGEDPKDLSEKRDYTVIVSTNFGLWVKEAKFITDSKGNRDVTDYSGEYYIASNTNDYYKNSNGASTTTNYYLCPTDETHWICYVDPDNYTNPAADNDQPFLTTYRYRNGTADATEALWIIEKAPVSTDNPNAEYYYMKHKKTNRYVTYNGPINTTTKGGVNRLRFHLQATPNANSLLRITQDVDRSPAINIAAVAAIDVYYYNDNGQKNCIYLNLSSADYQSLVGTSGKQDGPTGYKNVGATIGIWHTMDRTSEWYLEIPSPSIGYNSSGQVVISHPSTTTFYYTLDGSDPTTSSTPYTEPITLSEGITTVKAIAVYPSNAVSSPTTFMAFNLDGSHSYLIQSKEFDYYYMIPTIVSGEDTDGYHKLITNSLARPSMMWRFEDAGTADGKQYYYIVNQSTGQYVYYHTYENSKGQLQYSISCSDTNLDFSNIVDKDPYKFSIDESTYGGYTIRPKLKQTYWLCKGGGNKSNNNIAASGSDEAQGYSRWTFISYNGSVPNTAAPITAFVGDNKQYYKIASEAEPTYFISPAANVTTTTTESEDIIWYFEEASHDEWLTYYYIRNAKSNEFLYLKRTGDNALEMKATPTDDGKCLFAIAKSATDGLYIVPESKKYDGARLYYSLHKKANVNEVRVASARWWNDTNGNDNIIKWIITEASLQCETPQITWSSGDNGYVITTTTPGATIYYTINVEGEPAIDSSNEYTTAIPMSSLHTGDVIRAIAVNNGDAATISEMASLTIEQVETPVIQDNGNNAIEITCATAGATIYYTTDGTTTPTSASAAYSTPLTDVSGKVIKAIAVKGGYIDSEVATSGTIMFACATPVIKKTGANTFTITCSNPTEGVTIYYTVDGTTPTTSSTSYSGEVTFDPEDLPFTVNAIATAVDYNNSAVASKLISIELVQDVDGYYEITTSEDFETFASMVNGEGAGYKYKITADITLSSPGEITAPFTGELKGVAKDDGTFSVVSGLDHAIFNGINGGKVYNLMLDNVSISGSGNKGAIANEATGESRIYNCGILSGSVGGSNYVGGLVGLLDGTARVINCYSYATITSGSNVGGIVGYNNVASTQGNVATMVMNCMFYGDITITGGTSVSPVYGGSLIDNSGETGINNYNYYRRNRYDRENDTYVDDVTFDNNLALADYHCSWPADAKYLTRFEYYRCILNSNRKLCTWWVKGTSGTAPTDDDIEEVGIAKWVLDPSIAPYPILKKWGKYPSVINQDPVNRFDPSTKAWVNRDNASDHWGEDMAPDTEGQKLGTVTVTINGGDYYTGSGSGSKSIPITAMDTDNNDYCYGKIQLPYYNEIFGNPNGDTWEAKYGGNYTAHVVTGWKISGGSAATDYNFADRNSYDGRVFAQGGYFYVPKGVTSITITAHWADAVYLCNKDYSLDRVNVAAGGKETNGSDAAKTAKYGSPFTPAGTISNTFQGRTVYTTIKEAIGALSKTSSGKDVYNQAIVLIGNVQLRNHSSVYGATETNTRPFTLMSADLDFDNEPDNCLELQFRNDIDRPGVQPIRFDFLPVPELGFAIRTNSKAYAIGIMIPLGHFEITETAFMHTTQFEYDGAVTRNGKSPVIINGGEHEMFTKRKQAGSSVNDVDKRDRTSYFLLGGNAWVHRFAPGAHPNTGDKPDIYLFPVNVIGGQVKELYLTGLYRPELPITTGNNPSTIGGAPRCYIDGGKFDIVAGAGYDKVKSGEDVIFKINHSLIGEFYGGGINASNPVSGNIDVTINDSKVDKYCGGPKVGVMADGKTVKTDAKGTTFGVFFGGGNGGNSYYRQLQRDGDFASSNIGNWTTAPDNKDPYNFDKFNPLNLFTEGTAIAVHDEVSTTNKGYHAEYEFEVFNQSNGLTDEITQRGFIKWIQFGITTTGAVESTLENCKVLGNFYGGGNLASVSGDVTSTLTNTTVNGSVFGAGYSAAIPTFQVQNKDDKIFPSINDAGVITEGSIPYADTKYEWTNDLNGKSESERKANPTYEKNGKNYCYTWNSLDNLGTVTGKVTLNIEGTTTVKESVYGGGEESAVNGDTEVNVSSGTIGYANAQSYGALVGNVYGGGRGKDDDAKAGLVKGNTAVNISGDAEHPFIYHNVYGGGAYGSVGTYGYYGETDEYTTLYDQYKPGGTAANEDKLAVLEAKKDSIISYSSGGTCTVTITGGLIGTNGKENGMVFGSSRGDVDTPVNGIDPNNYLAWVHDTHVIIGTAGSTELTYPQINGSVYGSGENGHTYTNTVVDIHSGTIGIKEGGTITDDGGTPDDTRDDITYSGPRYPNRGNVYGGGCGTDTYTSGGKTYYNLNAGIVLGNTKVNIDGGHVVHNVYGAGAMGSAGTFTLLDYSNSNHADYHTAHPDVPEGKPFGCAANTGKCEVNVSGGQIGMHGAKMTAVNGPDDYGHVFGAGRGEVHDSTEYVNMRLVGYVNETAVKISGSAFITGSVYGGSESGHVLGNTNVEVSGGQIGCAEEMDAPYAGDWSTQTSMAECAHWKYEPTYAPYDMYSGDTGYDINAAVGGSKIATDGHTFYGNVFGGGSGYYPYAPGKWVRSAGLVEGSTNVTIYGGHILTNVYGGNEHTDVYGKCTVNMSGGTVGVPLTYAEKIAHPVTGNVFGAGKGDKRVLFNTWTNVGETEVNISGNARIYGSVLGGGEDGHVLKNAVTNIGESGENADNTKILIGTLGTTGYDGNVFGGGRGSYTALTAGVVCGNTEVNIWGGTMMGSVYGGGRLSSVGTYLVPPTEAGVAATGDTKYGKLIPDGKEQVIKRTVSTDNKEVMVNEDVAATDAKHGHTAVNIMGGTIGAFKDGKLVNSSYSTGDVFGACKGTTNGDFSTSYYSYDSQAQVKLGVCKTAIVNMLGGTVGNSIYGGGELGNIGTANSTSGNSGNSGNSGDSGDSGNSGDSSNGTREESSGTTSADPYFAKINLLGGSVVNVYGGGLGKKKVGTIEGAETLVMGDVKVNLNGLEPEDYVATTHSALVTELTTGTEPNEKTDSYRVKDDKKGCVVTGNIFGCNNLNGTPLGHAKVHVFATQNAGKDKTNEKVEGQYDVAAVYGGGNQADYKPTDEQHSTEVIIEGCNLSKIEYVYGGGNAAASPATSVLIMGTEHIKYIFGGGNGDGDNNPGANVGYYTGGTETYTGLAKEQCKALVYLMAGNVDYIYGGSNSKGDIWGGSFVTNIDNVNSPGCCDKMIYKDIYGGGKDADMSGPANIIFTCTNSDSWGNDIYPGAENANIGGDVTITITSGYFKRVFGGNKYTGKIHGSITINIEENEECGTPVVIGEIYGGGNKAPYSVYGYDDNGNMLTSGTQKYADPQINIRAFTSIGNIYGGGLGSGAVMYGSPTVNINEVNNNRTTGSTIPDPILKTFEEGTDDEYTVTIPTHDDTKIGAIGNVFGGGNAASVEGNTTVNIGTTEYEYLLVTDELTVGETVMTGYYTRRNTGTTVNPIFTYTKVEDGTKAAAETNYYRRNAVEGADIRGNVYGGGNEAIVTGNTNVNIGKEATTTP